MPCFTDVYKVFILQIDLYAWFLVFALIVYPFRHQNQIEEVIQHFVITSFVIYLSIKTTHISVLKSFPPILQIIVILFISVY